MKPKRNTKKHHGNYSLLRNYMTELSQLLSQKDQLDKGGRKLDDKQKSRIKSLANEKVKVLDEIIFPSMANLTYFFDAIEKDPNLQDTFSSDVKDLLGVRRLMPTPSNYAFMFTSLVEGIIGLSGRSEDFTLRLTHKLQEIIYQKAQHTSKDGSYILETKDASFRIFEDIQRALVWTGLVASRVKDEYDFSKFRPKYDVSELEECKDERQKKKYMEKIERRSQQEFEEYAKKNVPKRTFDFDTKNIFDQK